MAQMTRSLAEAILKGDGITRNEINQLCHHFLATLDKDKNTLHGHCVAEIDHLTQQLEAVERERPKITARGEWKGDELFWVFSAGKLHHEISDHDLRIWIRSPKAGFDTHDWANDGCIREKHTAKYIAVELIGQETTHE